MIDRRAFVLASAATALAGGALAQPARAARVGFLHPASAEGSTVYKVVAPGLAQLGYGPGTLLTRSGDGRAGSLPSLVEALVRANVDVLVVVGPAAVRAAVSATRAIPIVAIDLESDPVRNGWMRSLARPGGNVTGFFLDLTGMSLKWLQLLREAVPDVTRVVLVWDATTGDAQLRATRAAAGGVGIEARTVAIENWGTFDAAMGESLRARPQALVILSSPIAFQYSKRFADFAARNGLPAISPFRPFAEAGGLMSYGPDLDAFFRRVPGTIDRLLHGARPGDLAVEQPDRYELVVNRAAGQRLRLALPAPLLVRADEVINAP